jgi:O-antigen/teichoic acid export membrane protein
MAGFGAGAIYGALRIRQPLPLESLPVRVAADQLLSNRQFALFGVPAALVSNLGLHCPAMILAYCYSWEVAGMFALSQRVFTTPLTLLTHSLSRVYFAESTHRSGEQEPVSLFRKTVLSALLISTPPILVVAIAAPLAFPLVFGSAWSGAGWMCTLLAPLAIALALSQVVNPAFELARRQDQRLYFELACTALIAGGLVAGRLAHWPPLGAIAFASLGGAAGYAMLALRAAHYAQKHPTASTPEEQPQRRAA